MGGREPAACRASGPAARVRAAGPLARRRAGPGRRPPGITAQAFASPGRLRGHIADDRDLSGVFEFQRAAADLPGAEVTVYSDGALGNQHVSPDLVTATSL